MEDRIDFIGIGAAKSGTTWVAEALSEHPQVGFALRKELDFFNSEEHRSVFENQRLSNFRLGKPWYVEQFPPPRPGTVRGEFSVTYLTDPAAPRRMFDLFPEAKLLAVLRNPVDMVYSLHWYCRAAITCATPDDFHEAIERGHYLDSGRYAKHLARYLEYFPIERIHVMLFDDIRVNPRPMLQELWRFLEIDESFEPSVLEKRVNPAVAPRSRGMNRMLRTILESTKAVGLESLHRAILRSEGLHRLTKAITLEKGSYPPMDEELREHLTNYYRRDNNALEDLISRDLSAWG